MTIIMFAVQQQYCLRRRRGAAQDTPADSKISVCRSAWVDDIGEYGQMPLVFSETELQ